MRRILRGQDVDPDDRAQARQIVRTHLRATHPVISIVLLAFWVALAAANVASGHWRGVVVYGVFVLMTIGTVIFGIRVRRWRSKYLGE